MNNFDILYSPTVIEFVTLSGEYCGFIDKSSNLSQEDIIQRAQKILPLLYFKTAVLPKMEKETEGSPQEFVSELDYNYILTNISEKLDTKDVFLDILEPVRLESSEAISLSMSECFVDIYQDLKNFISNFQSGVEEIMADSLWECKYAFETFWGPRLIALLNEVHNITYSEQDEV